MKNYIYQNKWDTYKTTLNKIHGTEYVLHYFFLIFIGVQLLHDTVLVSVVQQSESAICIHISPYPLPL